MDVTTITHNATYDELADTDYREIYEEVRQLDDITGKYAVSLDKFVAMIDSTYSKGQWSKYHSGKSALTRAMRNELRAAVAVNRLPPTVAEVAERIDPDCHIVQVGDSTCDRAILIGSDVQTADIHVNSNITADETRPQRHVTSVTSTPRKRKRRFNISTRFDYKERRGALSASWDEVIEAGLSVLENDLQKGGE